MPSRSTLVLDPTTFLIGTVPFLAVLWWLSTRRNSGLPPSPGLALPLLGHLHLLEADPRPKFKTWRRQCGDVFSLYMGWRLVIVLCGVQTIKDALVKMGDVFSDRPPDMFVFDRISQKRGVLSSSGALWKEQRKTSLEIFRYLGMGANQLARNIQEEVTHYIRTLEAHKGTPIDLGTLTHVSVSNNICSIMFGKRFDYEDPEFAACVQNIRDNIRLTNTAALVNYFPWLDNLPGDMFFIKKILSNVDNLNAFIRRQAQEHYRQREDRQREDRQRQSDMADQERPDFIHAYLDIMEDKKKRGEETTLDVANLEHILLDLFMAGTETTSVAVSWALLLFLHFPEVQERCFAEIRDVVGPHRAPGMRDKPELVFVEATILEMLRWAAIVPIAVPRSTACDVVFRGYLIPKGAVVLPFLDSVLNDPEIWGDPENFRPDRFLDAGGKLVGTEGFIPFGTGRRNCLGESLSRMELFLYLTNLIQRFRFLPPEEEMLPSLAGIMGFTHAPTPYSLRAVPRVYLADELK